MEDRVSLYPGRVTLTPVEGQPNTYDMVRADQPTQQGTALSKANLLKGTTAAQFGLGSEAVPDDVLAFLGKYNEHWWKVRTYSNDGAYVLQETTVTHNANRFYIVQGFSETQQRTIQYSDQVTCNPATGEVTLVSPSSISTGSSYYLEGYSSLEGKYVKNAYTAPTEIVFVPTEITQEFAKVSAAYDYYFYTGNGWHTAMSSVWQDNIVVGEWMYIHSPDENAYPKSGISDKMEYQYLGRPFEKFPTMPQIETGSYTGTGTYGSNNPNSLTFKFAPKFVFVAEKNDEGYWGCVLIACSGMASVGVFRSTSSSSACSCEIQWNGTMISWWDLKNAEAATQMNASGGTYKYFAIG